MASLVSFVSTVASGLYNSGAFCTGFVFGGATAQGTVYVGELGGQIASNKKWGADKVAHPGLLATSATISTLIAGKLIIAYVAGPILPETFVTAAKVASLVVIAGNCARQGERANPEAVKGKTWLKGLGLGSISGVATACFLGCTAGAVVAGGTAYYLIAYNKV